MSGETPLTPEWKEDLAQSYALLVRKGTMPFSKVPNYPVGLKDRVAYLTSLE